MLTYAYFGTVFTGIARLLEEIIHSWECVVQKLPDLPASFALIDSLNDCSKIFYLGSWRCSFHPWSRASLW